MSDDDYYCGPNLACNLRVGLFDNPDNYEEFFNIPNPIFPLGYLPFGDSRQSLLDMIFSS